MFHLQTTKKIKEDPEVQAKFETTDFYLACYLRCIGYDLADVRRDGRRSLFIFRDKPKRRQDMMAYFNDEGTIRPLAFVGIIKDMKALIHNV